MHIHEANKALQMPAGVEDITDYMYVTFVHVHIYTCIYTHYL